MSYYEIPDTRDVFSKTELQAEIDRLRADRDDWQERFEGADVDRRLAEARLAAVIALQMYREVSPDDPTFSRSAEYVAGYDIALEQVRAAATGDTK